MAGDADAEDRVRKRWLLGGDRHSGVRVRFVVARHHVSFLGTAKKWLEVLSISCGWTGYSRV
jgi:hypothetical protein